VSVIRADAITMGKSSRASLGSGRFYRYNGDQPYVKPVPAEPLPQNVKTIAGKQARIAKYIRLRQDGADKYEAAAQLGVGRSTRRVYERHFEEQQGEGRDA